MFSMEPFIRCHLLSNQHVDIRYRVLATVNAAIYRLAAIKTNSVRTGGGLSDGENRAMTFLYGPIAGLFIMPTNVMPLYL